MTRTGGGRVVAVRCMIEGVEATAADTVHSFARHSHERFGVGLVTRGAQRSASGRGPVEAAAGDAITVNPGEVHDGSPLGGEARAWHMLYVEPILMRTVASDLEAASAEGLELERPVLRDARFAMLFEAAFAAAVASPDASNALARDEALFRFLADVVRRHTTARVKPRLAPMRAAASLPILRARARIDDDPAASPTLASLAAEAGLSRFQLLREFTRETGLPPHAYLVQRRVALARQLIAAGCALADAAAAAGFADQSHMTRAFVRMHGITPSNYASAVR